MGQRQIDMRAEQELAKFLDAHLYGELLKEGGFLSFQRVSDAEVQKQGIDVIEQPHGPRPISTRRPSSTTSTVTAPPLPLNWNFSEGDSPSRAGSSTRAF